MEPTNNPSRINTILLIIIIILLVIGIALLLENRRANGRVLLRETGVTVIEEISEETKTPSVSPDWKAKLPSVKEALLLDFDSAGTYIPVGILSEADLTGDGITEAVATVDAMGAYTSTAAIVRMKDGMPVVAKMKNNDGSITPASFESGASVMNQLGYGLLPEQNGFYTQYVRMENTASGDDVTVASCALYVYIWNPASELFEYNSPESIAIAQDKCPK